MSKFSLQYVNMLTNVDKGQYIELTLNTLMISFLHTLAESSCGAYIVLLEPVSVRLSVCSLFQKSPYLEQLG